MSRPTTGLATALTMAALIAAIVSLATLNWIVVEISGITINVGLWRTCMEALGHKECADSEYEGSNGTKMDVVKALMIGAVIVLAVVVVNGCCLSSHPDNKPVKHVAMGCDIFATVCLLIAVAVYYQFATDVDRNGGLHASFGLAIAAMVMSLASAACFGVAKPTPNPNQVITIA